MGRDKDRDKDGQSPPGAVHEQLGTSYANNGLEMMIDFTLGETALSQQK